MSRNRKRSLHNCAIQEIPLSHTKDSRKLRRRGQCSHPAEKSGQDEGWKNRFGHTAYGKVVLDEFVKQRKPASKSVDVELEIVDGYMTDAELEKTVAKVCTMVNAESFDPESRKMMGMFTSMCWKDLLIECPNWVKRMKNPTVDFGKLAGLCNARAKEHVKASGQ